MADILTFSSIVVHTPRIVRCLNQLFLTSSLTDFVGSIKKGNRHSEILLRDIEHISTLASLYKNEYMYPKDRIDENWEKVLLNQCTYGFSRQSVAQTYLILK